MFIAYQGLPFADAPATEQSSDERLPSFYTHEPHDFPVPPDFSPTPRLAYGRRFQSFSFLATGAGTLPRALQLAPTRPWLPASAIAFADDDPAAQPEILDFDCQRRTAITQMAVNEQPAPGTPRRIGEGIAGVQPLSADYPRRSIVATADLAGVIDIFCDSDGIGRMHFPASAPKPLEWRL
ncbi:hypothetical protein, partial [Novosphingobium sp. AP12]|uniref:hypothetical protein n=1 Tax=Novosphingobium sp. AP12 TaxID=1144305 RepID=UPI001EE660B3